MQPFVADMQHISERIDGMLADVARSREAPHWEGLLQLLKDAANHPRDITSVMQLARAAQEIESVFQLHQVVTNAMAESNDRLHGLLQDALQWNDSEHSQTRYQLLAGLRRVSEGIDSLLAEVTRSQEVLHWVKIRQIIGDVRNHPRDIANITLLARVARDLQGIFQLHQNVLDRAAESNHLLHKLISQASEEEKGMWGTTDPLQF